MSCGYTKTDDACCSISVFHACQYPLFFSSLFIRKETPIDLDNISEEIYLQIDKQAVGKLALSFESTF